MPKLWYAAHQEEGEIKMTTSIQSDLLNQKTQIINHKIKTIENNFLDIGQELKEIKDGEIYKEKYKSFEEYVEKNFVFTIRTAYRMIQVVELQNSSPASKLLSFSKWIELLSLPEDKRQELIEQAPNLTKQELREEVKTVNADGVASDTVRNCNKCGKQVLNKARLLQHEKTCIGKQSCEQCGYTPKNPRTMNSDLKRHLKTCKGIKKINEETQTIILEKETEIIESQPNPVAEKEFIMLSDQMLEMSKKTVPRLVSYVSRMRFKEINIIRRKELANHINSIIKQLRQIVEKNLR